MNTNNQDSLYYKFDTLKIIGFKIKDFKIDDCETVNWTFYKKKKVVLSKGHFCEEPPTLSALKNENYLDLKITETDSDLFIELYNSNKLLDKFKVLEIIQDNFQATIILKRLRI